MNGPVTDKKKDFAPGTHSARTGNVNLIQLPNNILENSFPFMPCTVQKVTKEGKVSGMYLVTRCARLQAASWKQQNSFQELGEQIN